jgi:hypothetical protein
MSNRRPMDLTGGLNPTLDKEEKTVASVGDKRLERR